MFSPASDISENRIATPIKMLKLPPCREDVGGEGFIEKAVIRETVAYLSDNYDKEMVCEELDKLEDQVSLAKFMEILQTYQVSNTKSISSQQLFKLYDRDGKGYIDKDDLERVAEVTGIYLSKQEIDEMLDFKQTAGKAQFHQFAEIMGDEHLWF